MLIGGLTAINAYQIRAAARERAVVTTLNLIRLVERQVFETMSKVDIALQTAVIEIDRELENDSPLAGARISEFLERQHALLPEVNGYRATDANGELRFGRLPPSGETFNIADREYFRYLKANPNAEVAVSGPILASVSRAWSIAIARPLRDKQGQFRGVVVATISVSEFHKKLQIVNLGNTGAATLRMSDMALVARATNASRTTEIEYGSTVTSQQLRRAIAESPAEGNYIAVTALDGIERVNAYMKVTNYPMYVIIGMATSDSAREWISQSLFVLTLGLLAIAITGLGAVSIAKQRDRDLKERIEVANKHAEELEQLALHDKLTGLPNRTLLEDRGKQAIAQHLRNQRTLAVAYLDLDGFKSVNDRLGHAAGDELLIELTLRMRDAVRDGDTLARIGGDEFVALINDLSDKQGATPVLQRLLAECSRPVQLSMARAEVSVSIGVAFMPDDGAELDLLMRKADHAMYRAKNHGRNNFAIFEES